MIYLLFPTHMEYEAAAGLLVSTSPVNIGLRPGLAGGLAGRPVTAIVTGVGQANTAQALTAVLEGGQASLVILGGCAGAYEGSGLGVGDVAVATEEIYADTGVAAPEGWQSLEDIRLPLIEINGAGYYNRFPLDAELVRRAKSALGTNTGVSFGPFLTVAAVSGTRKRGEELYAGFHALCENMEGAAAAQVALLYGAAFMEVRGISNMVEDRDRDKWNIKTASANCAKVIETIVKNLN